MPTIFWITCIIMCTGVITLSADEITYSLDHVLCLCAFSSLEILVSMIKTYLYDEDVSFM